MSKIASMINSLRLLSPEVMEQVVLAIILKRQDEVLDLNISQLQEGKDSKGRKIKPKYSPLTIEIKRFKGQPFDRVTLKDEGDFYRGFYFERVQFPLSIDSTDVKTDKLTSKYGKEIFGLDKKNTAILSKEILLQELRNYLREQLVHV